MSNAQRGRALSVQEQNAMRRKIADSAREDPHASELARHLAELEVLKPEIAALDAIEFIVEIDADGNITPPVGESTPGGYYAELYEIRGWMQDPGVNPDLLPLVSWNIRDRERSGDMFTTPQTFASLYDPLGGLRPLEMKRGLYVFEPGSTIEAKITVNANASTTRYDYATQASEAKRFGLQLRFNLYSV